MKMYILIKESVSTEFALVAVAHTSLATYLKYQECSDMKAWLAGQFYKVICKVNDKEFANAKKIENNVIITESALANEEVALGFCPRDSWPKAFKFYSLYRCC